MSDSGSDGGVSEAEEDEDESIDAGEESSGGEDGSGDEAPAKPKAGNPAAAAKQSRGERSAARSYKANVQAVVRGDVHVRRAAIVPGLLEMPPQEAVQQILLRAFKSPVPGAASMSGAPAATPRGAALPSHGAEPPAPPPPAAAAPPTCQTKKQK